MRTKFKPNSNVYDWITTIIVSSQFKEGKHLISDERINCWTEQIKALARNGHLTFAQAQELESLASSTITSLK